MMAMEVSKCSITPTTANRFSRLSIAICNAALLRGSPHSSLGGGCQRRFSQQCLFDVCHKKGDELGSNLVTHSLTLTRKSRSAEDLARRIQPDIQDRSLLHTCSLALQSFQSYGFRLASLFWDLSRLFVNHSLGGFSVLLLHRRALLLQQIS